MDNLYQYNKNKGNKKKVFVLLPLLIVFFVFVKQNLAYSSSGENMNTHQAMTLEQFNDRTHFLNDFSRFNIALFDQQREEHDDLRLVRPDGVEVRQLNNSDSYQEEITFPHSPFTYVNVYDKHGYVIAKALQFYGTAYGQVFQYDRKGKVTHTREIDARFVLTIDELRALMLSQYGVDIFVTGLSDQPHDKEIAAFSMTADEESGRSYYEVYIWHISDTKTITAYLVDGISGKVLLIQPSFELYVGDQYGERQASIYHDYYAKSQSLK